MSSISNGFGFHLLFSLLFERSRGTLAVFKHRRSFECPKEPTGREGRRVVAGSCAAAAGELSFLEDAGFARDFGELAGGFILGGEGATSFGNEGWRHWG